MSKGLLRLLLVALTLAAYGGVWGFDFVFYDDLTFVRDNPHVQAGLTRDGLYWAFTTFEGAMWHPLVWLSFMLDTVVFGPHAAGYHITNVLLHTLNVLVLFALWHRLTGAVYRSALVAALLAVHPIHVESVAWIAERKDVLSMLFALLTMWSYARYVEAPGRRRHALTVACFALGLMAKPMLVTLPFLLLLLDWWPLGRLGNAPDGRLTDAWPNRQRALPLIIEKVPLFALSAVASLITLTAQRHDGSLVAIAALPIGTRLAHSVVAYVRYLGKALWPTDLAFFYPYVRDLADWHVAVAALFLAGVSVAVLRAPARRAYVGMGWLWFLGTLLPVIGLVQNGGQAMADRYAYLPFIGLYVMVAWGVSDLLATRIYRAQLLGTAAIVVLVACLATTVRQVQHWRNTRTLAEHAIAVTEDNVMAHYVLGMGFEAEGQLAQAKHHYRETVRLGSAEWEAHNNLGVLLAAEGQLDDAIDHYTAALRVAPQSARVHRNLALALHRQERLDAALVHFGEALRLEPDDAPTHFNSSVVLLQLGRVPESLAELREAIRLDPHWSLPTVTLAWLLATHPDATVRDGRQAIALAEQAVRTNGRAPEILDVLAAAFAEDGRFEEASTTAQEAMAVARKQQKAELEAALSERMRLYQGQRAYRPAVVAVAGP